jgi:CBS domain-containing protein
MQDEGVRAMIVASAGSDLIAGVVTDLDLLRAVIEGRTDGMASDIMTLEPPPTVGARDPLARAVQLLVSSGAELLVVTDGPSAHPVGVLGYGDLAAHVAGGR